MRFVIIMWIVLWKWIRVREEVDVKSNLNDLVIYNDDVFVFLIMWRDIYVILRIWKEGKFSL